MSETTELDKSRRYLRPVASLPDSPHQVHLAVYQWLPMFDEWATGPGLCAESTRQGPLPEGTAVTCAKCLEWQAKYERMLAPGYRPEDDDPEVLRRRLAEAQAAVERVRKLHVDDGFGGCSECTDVRHVSWPCWTLRALDGEVSR